MNHQFKDINFKNNIFEYPDITRIMGEPNTTTLITLRNEIKTKAQTVHSTLEGGEHSHLGLVFSPQTCATLVPCNTPYIKLTNPGQLSIEGTKTPYQIVQRCDEDTKALCVFQESLGVERALLQQILATVEPKYLQALGNPVTNRIIQLFQTIFDYLFETYGDVTPQKLRHLTTQVESMNFHPNKHIHTIFTNINDLGTIAELS